MAAIIEGKNVNRDFVYLSVSTRVCEDYRVYDAAVYDCAGGCVAVERVRVNFSVPRMVALSVLLDAVESRGFDFGACTDDTVARLNLLIE